MDGAEGLTLHLPKLQHSTRIASMMREGVPPVLSQPMCTAFSRHNAYQWVHWLGDALSGLFA